MEGQVMCPVCTLYLRSGITLSDHLNTHPKESVIEAFVKTINRRPDEENNLCTGRTNINNVPSVMYQHFVNNYGPVNNGNYHNTVITANVSNATNASTIPVIVSPSSQPAPNPELYSFNYNPHPPAYNYNYAASQNSYSQANSFAYGQITNYERENGINETDPLSNQQVNISDRVPENSLNPPAVNDYDSHSLLSQSAVTVSVDTNVHTDLNKENNNRTDGREVQEGFPSSRQDETSQCSGSCEGDILDLDNQNRNTNIGTVISDSHQAISPHDYSGSGVDAAPPRNALEGETPKNSDAQNPEFFASSVTDRDEEEEGIYIIPEDNANFMDNAKQMANFAANIAASMAAGISASDGSPKGHHNSLESIFSDCEEAEEEEFVICDDIETAKRTERTKSHLDSNEEESRSFLDQGVCLDHSNVAEEACGIVDSDVDDDLNENDNDDDDDDDNSMMLSPIINIETDEMMPPHGELSGQESLSETSLWSNHCDNSSPPYQILYDAKQEACNKGFKEQQEDAKPEKCPTCSASFSHPGRYKIHIQTCCVKKEQDPLAGTSKDAVRSVCSRSKIDEKKFEEKKKFQCICCSLEFDSMKKLTSHVNLVHSLKSNQCPTCLEVFTTSVDFKVHVRTVHPLECTICGKYFNTRAGLQLHRKRHLSVRPYSCANCNKSFVTKQKLQEHVNVHLNLAPIRCKLCPNNVCFKSYSNLIQHRRVVHAKLGKKIKDYFCDCGEIFHSKKRLFWHSEMHGKPKSCRYCSRKFIHLSSLTRHIRRMHDQSFLPKSGRENKENVTCPVCKQMFLRTSLASHMQTHSGKKPYLCEICNKTFTTKWNLNAHRWIHMSRKLKPHKCNLCNAAFIHLPDLQAHERSHSNTRPFSCNHCGKQFIHQYNCIRHVREHEQDKRFTCEVCKKTFHRSYYLSEHLKIHSGVKPFSCHICGKTSTTKSNHNKHVRTHHAREPVSSEV